MTKLAVGDRVTLPDGTQGVVVNPEAQLEQAINASKEQAQLEADAARQEQRDLEDAIEQSQLTRDRAEALEREAPKTEAEEEEALSQAVDQSLQGERAFAEKLQRQYNDEAGYEKMMHIAEQDAVAAQFEESTKALTLAHDAKMARRAQGLENAAGVAKKHEVQDQLERDASLAQSLQSQLQVLADVGCTKSA